MGVYDFVPQQNYQTRDGVGSVWIYRTTYYPLVNKHSYGTWPFIVDFPIENDDFLYYSYVKLPEGTPKRVSRTDKTLFHTLLNLRNHSHLSWNFFPTWILPSCPSLQTKPGASRCEVIGPSVLQLMGHDLGFLSFHIKNK